MATYKTIADAEKDGWITQKKLYAEYPTLAQGAINEDVYYDLVERSAFVTMYFWGEKAKNGRPGAIATVISRNDIEEALTRLGK